MWFDRDGQPFQVHLVERCPGAEVVALRDLGARLFIQRRQVVPALLNIAHDVGFRRLRLRQRPMQGGAQSGEERRHKG